MVTTFISNNSPGSTPHVLHIYAQPTVGAELVELLPIWFKTILTGLHTQYHHLYKAARELKDWGILVDLAQYHNLDQLKLKANLEAQKWEAHTATFAQSWCMCCRQLEAACTAYQLANFKHLGPIQEQGVATKQSDFMISQAKSTVHVKGCELYEWALSWLGKHTLMLPHDY